MDGCFSSILTEQVFIGRSMITTIRVCSLIVLLVAADKTDRRDNSIFLKTLPNKLLFGFAKSWVETFLLCNSCPSICFVFVSWKYETIFGDFHTLCIT